MLQLNILFISQGNHESLVSKNGVYSKLVRKQLKKPKPLMIEELMKETDTDEDSSQDSGVNSQKSSDDEETI